MSTYKYPHTIENGAGERLTFVRRVQDPAGDRLGVENLASSPAADPPMHVHNCQPESLTVQQGRIGYKRAGEPPRFAGPGERRSTSSRASRTGSGTLGKRISSARATFNRPTT